MMQPSENGGMDSDAEFVPGGRRRRRKRRGQARRLILHGDAVGTAVGVMMALVSIGYLGWTIHRVNALTRAFGRITIGLTQGQTQYQFGKPQAMADGGGRWIYHNGAEALTFGFDGAGRLSEASCMRDGAAPQSCPIVLGVGLGAGEPTVWHELGRPEAVTYADGRKLLHYRGIGYVFHFNGAQVEAISFSPPVDMFARVRQIAWTLLP